MTLRWPMTFPSPTRQNNASPPTTTPRTLASTREVANLLQRDANPSDVIDQAIIVPLPDDDPDTDVTAF